ncbi:N-6 DNA methylase [uncultured Jannaschia sp.]|uniref:HsdM family class I SAM-dependent methyltransferase n=1 Tax=uncultured Jannaschia sp. TaxID=293347 RepID=UPI002617D57C|nr:N-6 DNA methylase [uncultured Jannaschia sp.]
MHYSTPPQATLAAPASTTPSDPVFVHGIARVRALAKDIGEAAGIEVAHAVLETAVTAFWHALSPAHAPRAPFWSEETVDLPDEIVSLCTRIGSAAAFLPVETAADLLGQLYSSALRPETRSTFGIFYTPPSLADLTARRATEAGADWSTARILDPACGAGALLLPALRRFVSAVPSSDPGEILERVGARLQGWDIDPAAAWLAQNIIDAALLPLTMRCGLPALRIIQIRDSLNSGANIPAAQAPDLIIGNPPYGKVRLSSEQRAAFSRVLFGRANLYALFLDRALDLVRPVGIVAFLTPTSCLGGEYYKILRKRLAEDAPPATIDFVVERKGVYDTAQQETLLATWQRGHHPSGIKLSEVQMAEGQLRVQEIGTGRLPSCSTAPWLLPRRVAHALVAPALHHSAHRLEDWGYRVRTGSVDGSGLKSRTAATSGPGRVPLIWAECVDTAEGFTWPGPRRRNAVWFDAGKEDLLRQPAILVQRTTAPEQPRRLVACLLPRAFIETHGAVGVEDHLNLVEPIDGTSAVPLEFVAAILKSRVADMILRCLSGSTAISATELRALPLPHRDHLAPLSLLMAEEAPDGRIERECARLYGIPEGKAML